MENTTIKKALMKYETEHGEVKLSPTIVKQYLVSGKADKVTEQEVVMFMQLCRYQGLNPFLREAYLIKFGNEPATIVTGKEVFTKRGSKNEACGGWEAGIIIQDSNGKIVHREGTFNIPDSEKLLGGWAKVYRKDWKVPIHMTVALEEYMRKGRDGAPMANWRRMPATMIRKVALVQALREAFPENFQGMYSPEEMPVDDSSLNDRPVEPVEVDHEVVEETNEISSEACEKGITPEDMQHITDFFESAPMKDEEATRMQHEENHSDSVTDKTKKAGEESQQEPTCEHQGCGKQLTKNEVDWCSRHQYDGLYCRSHQKEHQD